MFPYLGVNLSGSQLCGYNTDSQNGQGWKGLLDITWSELPPPAGTPTADRPGPYSGGFLVSPRRKKNTTTHHYSKSTPDQGTSHHHWDKMTTTREPNVKHGKNANGKKQPMGAQCAQNALCPYSSQFQIVVGIAPGRCQALSVSWHWMSITT